MITLPNWDVPPEKTTILMHIQLIKKMKYLLYIMSKVVFMILNLETAAHS